MKFILLLLLVITFMACSRSFRTPRVGERFVYTDAWQILEETPASARYRYPPDWYIGSLETIIVVQRDTVVYVQQRTVH